MRSRNLTRLFGGGFLILASLTSVRGSCLKGDSSCIDAQDVVVVITETGSGKKVANARVIHQRVTRKGSLFYPPDPILTEDVDQSLFEDQTEITDADGQAVLQLIYFGNCLAGVGLWSW